MRSGSLRRKHQERRCGDERAAQRVQMIHLLAHSPLEWRPVERAQFGRVLDEKLRISVHRASVTVSRAELLIGEAHPPAEAQYDAQKSGDARWIKARWIGLRRDHAQPARTDDRV